jgi:hypothetical protein
MATLAETQDFTAVTVRRLIETAGRILTCEPGTNRDDEEIGIITALITEAIGADPGDDGLTAEIVAAIRAARTRKHLILPHEDGAWPLPNSVHDREGWALATSEPGGQLYPLTATCGTCHGLAYRADPGAGWQHIADAVPGLRPRITAQLAAEFAIQAGLTAPDLAALTGQPLLAVQAVLAELQADSIAHALQDLQARLVRWFLVLGGNRPLRDQVTDLLTGAPPLGLTRRTLSRLTGRRETEIGTELDAMRQENLVRYAGTDRKTTWFLLDHPDKPQPQPAWPAEAEWRRHR